MLNDVFEEGDLLNEDDNDDLIPNESEEQKEGTTNVNETLDIENVIDLGPWIFIENSTLLTITRKYDSEDDDDEDWNPDEINSNAK